jgi:hypothetical protein
MEYIKNKYNVSLDFFEAVRPPGGGPTAVHFQLILPNPDVVNGLL